MFVFSKDKPKIFNPIKKSNKNYGKIKTGTHRKNKKDLVNMSGSNKVVKKSRLKQHLVLLSKQRRYIERFIGTQSSSCFPRTISD